MRLLGILILTLAAGVASGSELVLSGGFAPPRTTTEGSPAGGMSAADSSGMLLLNFGGNFFNFGSLALGYEIPPQDFEVKPGTVTDLQTGILPVPGSTDEYYYVLDSTGKELAHNKLSRPLAFMPGARTVKVNETTATVQIAAGSSAELKTGALLLHGTTDEYYYVFSAAGTELAHHKLDGALSFVEGNYTVKVNNASLPVKVEAGKTNEYQTATLSVNGGGDQYYYVLDPNGTELGHNKLNAPLPSPKARTR